MAEGEVRGLCPPRFAAVREMFAAHFAEGLELGARFALAIEGEIVVDLIGGWADRDQTRPFAEDTLTPLFSTTKALAAFMIARLVDASRIAYDQPVIELWPEFGAAGKERLTVEQVMSHQAGTASGYHPVTFGYLAGEIFRRADGRTLGKALHEDVAEPLGLDLWIGLPDAEHHRVAEVRRPPAMPDLGPITEPKRLAFLTKWATPGGVSPADYRRAEIPSANGHATAPALARLMAALASDGALDASRLLEPGMAAEAARQRIAGADLVLPYTISWGAGFIRNQGLGIYGPGHEAFGHSGWGGSCAFADPERGVSGAYVMNRQSAELISDPRSRRLIEAAYAGL
jgi:CubicO group peptidase (beta-lactamase class C family)